MKWLCTEIRKIPPITYPTFEYYKIIYLDDIIYEEPYIITYSEQPKEFKLSNLSKVGTVRIEFDSSKDGGGSGPSYGISDIYLKHTSTH